MSPLSPKAYQVLAILENPTFKPPPKGSWEFRHQISKAKYLKMSVGHIGKLQENTVALCKMVVKLSEHSGGMSAEMNSDVRHPVECREQLHPDSLRGYVARPYPDSLREKHTTLAIITPRTIAYPIRICCPDHWLKCTSLATSFDTATPRRRPMVCSDIAMDSKELSSILDCFVYKSDGNSHSEDIVEKIVQNLNMLLEMIGFMIHNQENMALEAIRAQHHIDSI
ncbi:hypothetical protein AAG906_004984 [Vitis piasezkii]